MKWIFLVACWVLCGAEVIYAPHYNVQAEENKQSKRLSDTLIAMTPPPLQNYQDTLSHKTYMGTQTITYDITSRGVITADMDEFARLAHETLNDKRGWARMGLTFERVAANGDFSLVLSASDMMTSFSMLGCHQDWSCNVGRNVIINQDRWLEATIPWNAAGGNLRDYRHMVVNHEVGHNLGRDHKSCNESGQLASVMQQQSYDLQGCRFNPWPLPSEVVRSAS